MYKYKKDYSRRLFRLKSRAKEKGVPFDLMIDDVKELHEKERCFYCEEKFKESRRDVDRFIPSKGYIKSNCVMACNICNRIKGSMVKNDKRFIKIKKVIHTIETLSN